MLVVHQQPDDIVAILLDIQAGRAVMARRKRAALPLPEPARSLATLQLILLRKLKGVQERSRRAKLGKAGPNPLTPAPRNVLELQPGVTKAGYLSTYRKAFKFVQGPFKLLKGSSKFVQGP